MTGSGTQFNMNVNEVFSNRACQLAGTAARQQRRRFIRTITSICRSRPTTASLPPCALRAAIGTSPASDPAVTQLRDAIAAKAEEWKDVIKIGRTHMQDATPITLGQEWSGYAGMLSDDTRAPERQPQKRLSPCPRGHRRRHRHQRSPRLRRSSGRRNRQADRLALRHRAQQIHGARRARCPGAAFRHDAHPRRVALQNRQRHPPDVLRPARRLRRTDHPGKRTRLIHHARQGQSRPRPRP